MNSVMAALIYLIVSIESAVFQTVAFWWLRRHRGRRGTARTIICRILAAVIYVGIGITALIIQQSQSLFVTLLVFSFIQLMWQVNSVIDLATFTLSVSPQKIRHHL